VSVRGVSGCEWVCLCVGVCIACACVWCEDVQHNVMYMYVVFVCTMLCTWQFMRYSQTVCENGEVNGFFLSFSSNKHSLPTKVPLELLCAQNNVSFAVHYWP